MDLKIEFFEGIFSAYETGNPAANGLLDFDEGFRSILDYLTSKIGTKYDDDFIFTGFEITLISKVIQIEPPGEPITRHRIDFIGSKDDSARKLFAEEPWINAPGQSRDYSVPETGPERTEQFDFFVTAYICREDIQWISFTSSMSYLLYYYHHSEPDYNTDVNVDDFYVKKMGYLLPIPNNISEEKGDKYKKSEVKLKISIEKINQGRGLSIQKSISTKGQRSYEYLFPDEHIAYESGKGSGHNHTVFYLLIHNPLKKKVEVRLTYDFENAREPERVPDSHGWNHENYADSSIEMLSLKFNESIIQSRTDWLNDMSEVSLKAASGDLSEEEALAYQKEEYNREFFYLCNTGNISDQINFEFKKKINLLQFTASCRLDDDACYPIERFEAVSKYKLEINVNGLN